jgi:chlorobactene glucosyltransferase
MWVDHLEGLLIFIAVLLLIAAGNILTLLRLGRLQPPQKTPRTSILVPARNEENNIQACIASLLAQDYPDFQVIALDDHSTDLTGSMLTAIAENDARLIVLAGKDLPTGWLGKHWACQQLSESADGELLLFTDADTVHDKNALPQAVTALQQTQAAMLSALVHQRVVTWSERLAVPVMNWSILSIFPFFLAHSLPLPMLAIANGQFLLFRREAYAQLGGHAAIKSDPVDDIALARRAAQLRIRWRMVDASAVVHCRMYRHRKQVLEGFTKNLYATFGRILPLYLFIWIWLVIAFLEPLLVVARAIYQMVIVGPIGSEDIYLTQLAIAAIILTLAQWGLVYWRLSFPIRLIILYPVSVIYFAGLALRSLIFNLTGKATWKGRVIRNP